MSPRAQHVGGWRYHTRSDIPACARPNSTANEQTSWSQQKGKPAIHCGMPPGARHGIVTGTLLRIPGRSSTDALTGGD
jgi:hypothetical protein